MKIPSIYYKTRISIRQKWRIYKFRWQFFRSALSNYWKLQFGIISFIALGLFIYLKSWTGNDPIFQVGDKNTWINISSELHGLLFDILLFGIVLVIFEKVRDKRDIIIRYLEELDDYRGWDSPESYQRTHGVIRRLINQKFFRINMEDIYLKKQKIYKPLNFEYSYFNRTILDDSEFYSTFFISPSFLETSFHFTRFDECKFLSASFTRPHFRQTIFENCEFDSAVFHGLYVNPEYKPLVFFRNCKFKATDFKYFNAFSITGLVNCTFEGCEAFEYHETRLQQAGLVNGVTFIANPQNHIQRMQDEEQILNVL